MRVWDYLNSEKEGTEKAKKEIKKGKYAIYNT